MDVGKARAIVIDDSPLDRLHTLLTDLNRAIQNFNKNLVKAHDIAAQWSLPTWMREKHPEQDALKDLVSKIDKEKQLSDQLKQCGEAISAFNDFHQELIQFFAGEDKKNEAEIMARLTRAFQSRRRKLEDDKKQYKEVKEAVVEIGFREKVQAAKQNLQWIATDLQDFQTWITAAADLDDKLKQSFKDMVLQDQRAEFDLPQGLSPDAAKDIFNDKLNSTAFQTLQQDASSLMKIITDLMHQKIDERQVKTNHDELERLNDSYNKAKINYQAFLENLREFKGLCDAFERKVSENLLQFKEEDNSSEEQILSLLLDYLNYPGVIDGANVGLQITNYLQAREKVTSKYKSILEDHLANAQLKLAGLKDIREEVEAQDRFFDVLVIPSNDRMIIDNASSPGWQDRKLNTYKAKLGIEALQASEQSFKKQLEQLEEKQRNLLTLQASLQQTKEYEQQEIETLIGALLTDRRACTLDNCEAHFQTHLEVIFKRIEMIKANTTNCLTIKEAIDEKLKKFKEITGFASDLNVHLRQCADRDIHALLAELDVLGNEGQKESDQKALQKLQEIRQAWLGEKESLTKPDAILNLDKLSPRFPVSENVFYGKFQAFALPLLSFTGEQLDISESAGDIYKGAVITYNCLIEKRDTVLKFLREIAPELFPKTTGVSDSKLFKEIELHFNSSLSDSKKEKFAQILNQHAEKFLQDLANAGWHDDGLDTYTDEARNQDKAFPRQLQAQFEHLVSYTPMISDFYLAEELEKKKELLEAHLDQLAHNNVVLSTLKSNIKTFFARLHLNKTKILHFLNLEPDITEKRQHLKEVIDAVKRAKELSGKSLLLIKGIDEAVRGINADRLKLFELLNSAMAQLESDKKDKEDSSTIINKLVKTLRKVESEVNFKNNILSLYQNISAVKQTEAAITPDTGESFKRLRCEFLYAGKSREIIAELKTHRQRHHVQTPKAGLIDNFLQGLIDENRFADLQALLDYLDRPFGNNAVSNQMLFANTGWTNLGGHGLDSTTRRLIGKLRTELVALVSRERTANVDSITHATHKDCEEIKREYNDILEKKDIGRAAKSVQNAKDCNALMAQALVLPEDATAIKIRQDLMDIQRWSGADSANLACRKARMECAIAIRQNAPNRQALYAQYKFSYSYQALRYHLENVTTNRKTDLDLLWSSLDDIAFGEGDENYKYTQMRQLMLRYFNYLRQEDSCSVSGFFGRVSRLTRATENFLLIDANDRGLGYKNGDGDDEVHHVEESGLFALRCCLPG